MPPMIFRNSTLPNGSALHYNTKGKSRKNVKESKTMPIQVKRLIILAVIVVAGVVLGRLAVRAVGNMLLGGTLFGGNFL